MYIMYICIPLKAFQFTRNFIVKKIKVRNAYIYTIGLIYTIYLDATATGAAIVALTSLSIMSAGGSRQEKLAL